MKKLCSIIAIVSILAAGSLVSASAGSGDLDRVLNNMQQAAKTLKTIRADLYQEKHLTIGGREISSGQIFFKRVGPRADKVRIKYSKPAGQEVGVNGEQITLYQAGINQAIMTTRKAQATKNQEFSFVATPYTSVPQLKSQYNVVLLREENVNGAQTSVLELTPKTASSARKVVLWVDHSSWLPIRTQVAEKNGDVTTFTLGNIQKNASLSESDLRVNVPRGAKVVRQ